MLFACWVIFHAFVAVCCFKKKKKKKKIRITIRVSNDLEEGQWLSGRVFDSRPRGRGFEPHRRHCLVSLSKNINPSLVLAQPRKTRLFITERLLMGRKESNQTNDLDTFNGIQIVKYDSSLHAG